MREHPPAWLPGATVATARERARMLATARGFFAEHGILEVETPALSAAAGTDPHIETVAVRLAADRATPYFLHTSPEFAMKRLLCAGWPDIYQVCKVYRDGEVGRRHQPEFTMVEWYRRDLSLDAMIGHTVAFLERLLDNCGIEGTASRLSYQDAFREHAGLDPLTATTADLQAACTAGRDLRTSLGDRRDAWLDLLLSSRIAPALARDRLTVVHHYPASQAALARLCPDDVRTAERFEVFLGETELANGYRELRDPTEQRARFAADQQLRAQLGLPQRPLDERFLAALHAGLPDCCGVAVGFDRLVMLNTGHDSLRQVQTFAAVSRNDD